MTIPEMLFPWQLTEVISHGEEPKRAIFADPRLGKTVAALESALPNRPKRAVVVAPLVACPMWADAARAYGFPTFRLFTGAMSSRADNLRPDGIAIVNWDAMAPLEKELIQWNPDALVGDESHLIKSPSAKRAKAFRRLAWRTPWVRLLSGTPAPNHYGDLWGQMVALDPDEWGRSYERFARRYLIRDSMFPTKVLGHINEDELRERLLRYCTIVRREDVFGPDTWQFIDRQVELPPEARSMYDSLASDWYVGDDEGDVSAEHVLKRIIRLQQLTSGYLPMDGGQLRTIHRAKIDAVLADLEEIALAGEKAVLFHRFRWEGEQYVRELAGKVAVVVINGDTSSEARQEALDTFARVSWPMVAVVQTQSGGVGISFAAATHALFVSRGFSYTDDNQARDRIYSPGGRKAVTYYNAKDTIDGFITDVLADKQNIADAVKYADVNSMVRGMVRRRFR